VTAKTALASHRAVKTKKNMAKTIFNMADQIITPGNVARS